MKFCVFVLAGVFSLQVFASQSELRGSTSAEFILWWSINAGGSIYSGTGTYRLSSSVGQSIAGRAEGPNYVIQAGFWNPTIIFVGIDERVTEQIPRAHSIWQNYPNPFHRTTTIRYGIPKSERVKLEVFNSTGQSVRVLVEKIESPGYKVISWDGRDGSGIDLGCGVYFCRITTPEFHATKKMLLLR